MQLTSKGANMVVDFYPVKFADGEISTRYILKTVTFMGQSQSKRYVLKKDFRREVYSRVEGYDYEVTDMHTEPQLFNSAMCLACWYYLFSMLLPSVILMTTDNIVDRDELQNAYVDRVIDGMDIKTMAQIIADQLHETFDNYSVNELINEVEEYYPDLLEDELSEGR